MQTSGSRTHTKEAKLDALDVENIIILPMIVQT